MRNPAPKILLAAAVAILPASAPTRAADEKPPRQQAKPAAPTRPAERNACAIYGAGFVRIEGSSTCVKIGGHVTIDVGSQVGR